MLSDAKRQIPIATTSANSSLVKTFFQFNPYTMLMFELSDFTMIIICCPATFNIDGFQLFSTFWLIDCHTVPSRYYTITKDIF